MFLPSRLFSQLVSRCFLPLLGVARGARSRTGFCRSSGHWEGAGDAWEASCASGLDLMRGDKGSQGTVGMPSEHLKGIRLQKVASRVRTMVSTQRRDQPFGGSLSTDGRSMTGDLRRGFSCPSA
jgi:hypothetical protein